MSFINIIIIAANVAVITNMTILFQAQIHDSNGGIHESNWFMKTALVFLIIAYTMLFVELFTGIGIVTPMPALACNISFSFALRGSISHSTKKDSGVK